MRHNFQLKTDIENTGKIIAEPRIISETPIQDFHSQFVILTLQEKALGEYFSPPRSHFREREIWERDCPEPAKWSL